MGDTQVAVNWCIQGENWNDCECHGCKMTHALLWGLSVSWKKSKVFHESAVLVNFYNKANFMLSWLQSLERARLKSNIVLQLYKFIVIKEPL